MKTINRIKIPWLIVVCALCLISNLKAQDTNSAANNTAQLTVSALSHPYSTTNRPSLSELIEKEIEIRNKPIDFYGLVIDQNSNAISGVKIKSGIRHWKNAGPEFGYVGATTIQLETTTGIDGRFELTGASGDGFGVLLTKDGYDAGPNKYGFDAATRDYANPVIFKMWKIGEKAQLVGNRKFWGIIPDGRVYTIDFLKEIKVESTNVPGDLRISIVRPSEIKPRTKFDWSFSMEAIQGGVVRSEDEFMYLAPDSGYQSNYHITMNSTNSGWSRELDRLQFYFKSRNGEVFGRLNFDLIPDYNNNSVFNVDWAVNPNGSRNLQP